MVFAIDFDGTLAEHRYPNIGNEVPRAFRVLKELQSAGHKLILLTFQTPLGGARNEELNSGRSMTTRNRLNGQVLGRCTPTSISMTMQSGALS
jgi:ribonucleotide monophosphatase NagD (HAD superfamily)